MIIRKAQRQDVQPITACARAAYSIYVDRIGRKPAPMVADFATQVGEGLVYVIGEGRTIYGYVVFYPRKDHIHLENVAVWPEHTGKGLGGQLIAFVEDEARRNGFATVELYTNRKMFENLSMYPKLGYVELDRWTEDGFERVFFRKNVSQPQSV